MCSSMEMVFFGMVVSFFLVSFFPLFFFLGWERREGGKSMRDMETIAKGCFFL